MMRVLPIMFLLLFCTVLSGCGMEEGSSDKIRDLEFTVIGREDAPQTLRDAIEEKGKSPFQLTYADGDWLYIVVGAGEQKSGGYSILVQELYLTGQSVVISTELQGPQEGEAAGKEPSYPILIVRTEFTEEPVVFR